MSTTHTANAVSTIKEKIINLTNSLVLMTISDTNYTNHHICEIRFFPKEDLFLFIAYNTGKTLSLSYINGMTLLKNGVYKNLILLDKQETDTLLAALTGREVVFGDTDCTDTLKFNKRTFCFTAQFGSNTQSICMLAARTLLETGELPNLQLL